MAAAGASGGDDGETAQRRGRVVPPQPDGDGVSPCTRGNPAAAAVAVKAATFCWLHRAMLRHPDGHDLPVATPASCPLPTSPLGGKATPAAAPAATAVAVPAALRRGWPPAGRRPAPERDAHGSRGHCGIPILMRINLFLLSSHADMHVLSRRSRLQESRASV